MVACSSEGRANENPPTVSSFPGNPQNQAHAEMDSDSDASTIGIPKLHDIEPATRNSVNDFRETLNSAVHPGQSSSMLSELGHNTRLVSLQLLEGSGRLTTKASKNKSLEKCTDLEEVKVFVFEEAEELNVVEEAEELNVVDEAGLVDGTVAGSLESSSSKHEQKSLVQSNQTGEQNSSTEGDSKSSSRIARSSFLPIQLYLEDKDTPESEAEGENDSNIVTGKRKRDTEEDVYVNESPAWTSRLRAKASKCPKCNSPMDVKSRFVCKKCRVVDSNRRRQKVATTRKTMPSLAEVLPFDNNPKPKEINSYRDFFVCYFTLPDSVTEEEMRDLWHNEYIPMFRKERDQYREWMRRPITSIEFPPSVCRTRVGLKMCRTITFITKPYCPRCTRRMHGLRVGPSSLPSAGAGLFATRDFEKGSPICKYTGRSILLKDYIAHKRDNKITYSFNEIRYAYYNRTADDQEYVLIAATSHSGIGRYINDPRKPSKTNCYSIDGMTRYSVWIHASRPIAKGEEIFVSYGMQYWKDIETMTKGMDWVTVDDLLYKRALAATAYWKRIESGSTEAGNTSSSNSGSETDQEANNTDDDEEDSGTDDSVKADENIDETMDINEKNDQAPGKNNEEKEENNNEESDENADESVESDENNDEASDLDHTEQVSDDEKEVANQIHDNEHHLVANHSKEKLRKHDIKVNKKDPNTNVVCTTDDFKDDDQRNECKRNNDDTNLCDVLASDSPLSDLDNLALHSSPTSLGNPTPEKSGEETEDSTSENDKQESEKVSPDAKRYNLRRRNPLQSRRLNSLDGTIPKPVRSVASNSKPKSRSKKKKLSESERDLGHPMPNESAGPEFSDYSTPRESAIVQSAPQYTGYNNYWGAYASSPYAYYPPYEYRGGVLPCLCPECYPYVIQNRYNPGHRPAGATPHRHSFTPPTAERTPPQTPAIASRYYPVAPLGSAQKIPFVHPLDESDYDILKTLGLASTNDSLDERDERKTNK